MTTPPLIFLTAAFAASLSRSAKVLDTGARCTPPWNGFTYRMPRAGWRLRCTAARLTGVPPEAGRPRGKPTSASWFLVLPPGLARWALREVELIVPETVQQTIKKRPHTVAGAGVDNTTGAQSDLARYVAKDTVTVRPAAGRKFYILHSIGIGWPTSVVIKAIAKEKVTCQLIWQLVRKRLDLRQAGIIHTRGM